MAKQAIGLDIGTDAVRATEIRLGERPIVTRVGQVALPSGSVVEGEVIEPGDVAAAIRRLLKDSGINGKSVHIGVPPSRSIVRTIEVGDMPEADLRSAIGFELEDHVPLDPADTAYDILPLERIESDTGTRRRVVLAAAPQAAIRPAIEAVQQAGRKVESINVAPLALSRVFASSTTLDHAGSAAASVDLIVSIGAGTMLVLVCTAGELLYNRKTTSPVGTRLTDGIQDQLAIGREVAEQAKRRVITDDNRHLLSRVSAITDVTISDLIDEVRDSIEHYHSQTFSRSIDRIVLTGGGSLIAGLDFHLADTFGFPVSVGDPFESLRIDVPNFGTDQRLAVAPFMATSIAYALGGLGRFPRVDLSPKVRKAEVPRGGVLVVGAIGVAALLGVGALTVSSRSEVSSIRAEASGIQTRLDKATADLAVLKTQNRGLLTKGQLRAIVAGADARRIDWTTSFDALDALGLPLGVTLDGFTAIELIDAKGTASGPRDVAEVRFSGSAPTLDAIAAWITTIDADPRFAAVATPSVGQHLDVAGGYRFDATVHLTDQTLFVPPVVTAATVVAGAATGGVAPDPAAPTTAVSPDTAPTTAVVATSVSEPVPVSTEAPPA